MLVIINADDLGAGKDVNDAIFDLISQGLISSASIIANWPYLKDVIQRIRQVPHISFGVHLNLTEFMPLTVDDNLKAILDYREHFAGKEKLQKSTLSVFLCNSIYHEFCNQVDKLLSLGIKISHIDSHEHIHTIPRLFPVIKRVQKKYGLNKVRISRNIYRPDHKISFALYIKKLFFNFMLRHIYKTKTTYLFCNLTEFHENTKNNILHGKSIEIMVHPGSEKYTEENKILKPLWYKDLSIDLRLINDYEL